MVKHNFNKHICFYFQVHQPFRLREISFFEDDPQDIFRGPDAYKNEDIFHKVADKCYLPATKMFLRLAETNPDFRVAYSLSGVFLEQCEMYGEKGKEVLDLFKRLAETGRCEFLAETYYHSLSYLFSKEEFAEQIHLHSKKIKQLFGVTPKVFRNTELIYRNDVGEFIRQMGFDGMVCEGWDHYLHGSSPYSVRSTVKGDIHPEDSRIAQDNAISKTAKETLPLLLKSYQLSDDLAFRFGNKGWPEWPMTTDKYAQWLDDIYGETINLFMDYETIGEHQWEDTGIFHFFEHLPEAVKHKNIGFRTPSETIAALPERGEYNVPDFLSWADSERNLSAWVENDIQHGALEELGHLEGLLHKHKKSKKPEVKHLLDLFRKLSTSDHLYYMCTKYWSDGDVHKYFSCYESPYEAYITFMNAMRVVQKKANELG
jgi:alpha-amylase